MLLAVLSEMASDEMPPDDKVDLRASVKALDKALQFDDLPISDSRHSIDSVKDDRSDRESTISLSGTPRQYLACHFATIFPRNNRRLLSRYLGDSQVGLKTKQSC